jgi:hypothetical protein
MIFLNSMQFRNIAELKYLAWEQWETNVPRY